MAAKFVSEMCVGGWGVVADFVDIVDLSLRCQSCDTAAVRNASLGFWTVPVHYQVEPDRDKVNWTTGLKFLQLLELPRLKTGGRLELGRLSSNIQQSPSYVGLV